MSSNPPTPGDAGQTFLIGDHLYLRALEASDAKHVAAWHPSPFPVPFVRAEERLKEEAVAIDGSSQQRLIACRRGDDRPVGSVECRIYHRFSARVRFVADRTLDPAAASAAKAEMLSLVVPWLGGERQLISVVAEYGAWETPVATAAAENGMLAAFRLREAFSRGADRADLVATELLSRDWLARLGDPRHSPPTPSAPPTRPVRPRPAPPPHPAGAFATGSRVYLRAMETDDWQPDRIPRWSRQESETFYRAGRPVLGQLDGDRWVRGLAKQEPPTDIEFAVVLRDGDRLIGDVGLYEIDWLHRTAETGSALYLAEYRGSGLGSEAKGLLLGYAFDELGLHAVRSFVASANTRSGAALRKQGYRDAGRFYWAQPRDGGFSDLLIFDLLAAEWRSLPLAAR